jgi:uncharacterized protein YjdB
LPQPATSISITGISSIIKDTQYSVNVMPTYTTNKTINWSVSDETIATINNGILTPIKNGSVIIYAKTVDGSNLTASKTITISGQKAKLNNLISNIGVWSEAYNTNKLDFTINIPFSTSSIEITPTYNDGLIINSEYGMCLNGLPINISLSNTTTIFTFAYGGSAGYDDVVYNITINKTGEMVMLDKEYISLTVGESSTLTATSNQSLTWATTDSSIVAVDQNGNIRAIGEGTATISVTNADGNKTECIVNVTPKIYPYTISNLSVNTNEINIDILKNVNRLTKDNIIVVSYNESGKIVQIDVTDMYFKIGVITNLTSLLTNTQYSKVKIFIWDNLSGLKPLSNIAEFNLNNRPIQQFSLMANCVE